MPKQKLLKDTEISVVIPAYNEENAVADTIAEVHKVFKAAKISKYEVIIVNDGSSDKTKERGEACDATILSHPHNVGYGASLKTGIRNAQYDTIVITDADRTYPFEDAPKLIEEYLKGFDMVVGARTGKIYKGSSLKYPLRKILKFLVEFTAGRKIPDINSGLRVFSKKTILPYLNTLCDTFSFTTSVTLAYMMTSKFVTYLPIEYNERDGETKVRLFKDSMRTLQYILQAITYYNPIKIFILFAGCCILLSLCGFILSTFFGIMTGFYLGIGGLLVSLLVLCMGLVADLLKQIMNK